MPFPWTDEQCADLRLWWLQEGLSAMQISKKLTAKYKDDVSRNAVIGKATRLGIAGENRITQPASAAYRAGGRMNAKQRAEDKPVRASRTVKLVPGAPKPVSPTPAASNSKIATDPIPLPPPELVVVGQAVVMSDIVRGEDGMLVERGLRSACCKYPVGPEPAIGEAHLQLFCAAPTGDAAQSYCERHQAIAFKPSSAADKAKRLKGALNAAHRDMLTRNIRRNSSSTRAVF